MMGLHQPVKLGVGSDEVYTMSCFNIRFMFVAILIPQRAEEIS